MLVGTVIVILPGFRKRASDLNTATEAVRV
jgi:hypothetical protein